MDNSKPLRDQKVALFDKLIASHPASERKGATIPYTSVNGHMYCYLTKDNFVALRLPETEREKFLRAFKTTLVEQYGIIQKEYVTVPDSLLKKTEELRKYLVISYEYVRALKPKPASKRKK